jgi:hypothetical protein
LLLNGSISRSLLPKYSVSFDTYSVLRSANANGSISRSLLTLIHTYTTCPPQKERRLSAQCSSDTVPRTRHISEQICHSGVSYEEEDTCVSYEEDDTCVSYEEEDTCVLGGWNVFSRPCQVTSYEEEDTCVSYEEEDTCVCHTSQIYHLGVCLGVSV